MNSVIKISGLDCANCARELEEEISKIEGVESASVDFVAQKVYVDCNEAVLKKVKDCCNRFEEVKVVEDADKSGGEKIKIKGLCCANCARELEEELNKIEGVNAVVDFMNMTIVLNATFEGRKKAVYAITHFEDVKIVNERVKKSFAREKLADILCIVISALFFIPAFVLDLTGLMESGLALKITAYTFFGIAYLSVGYKVLWLTAKNIIKGKIFDENFLMTIASVGAILLGVFEGEGFAEGVAVMLLYQIGELLQAAAVGSSRGSIAALMNLKSETANLISGEEIMTVQPEQLKAGDKILIKAGEKVPVDCVIYEGSSSLDMKSLNGEPLPRDVAEGDSVLSGSINISGVLKAEVVREYKNSAVAKILDMVENSTAKKSKPELFITKFAKYYTPAVCAAALIVAALVPTVICAVQASFTWATYSEWIYKALGFLVISCPCAMVISVPLSYFGGIGRCAKFGILVKGSTCLDELALAKVAAFDKTGTVTEGVFTVTGYTDERTLKLAASAEKASSHPIAAAFENVAGLPVTDAKEEAGKGVVCTLDNKPLLCGSAKLLREHGVEFFAEESPSTVVYVAHGGKYIGCVFIDDKVKSGAAQAVRELKKQGVEYTQMLTGDCLARAQAVAAEVGFDGVSASLLPDEKCGAAQKLKERGKLLYVGDGINDAPVMAAADCAVSMGKVGSDAAIEASDIVLVSDSLPLIPKGRKIARGTRYIVMQNIIGSLIIKLAIMALDIAISGFPLIISVIADVGVMLVAVLNAMRTAFLK